MAFVLRGRKVAYDNIAVGQVAGRENPAAGSAPTTDLVGGGVGTGATAIGHSNITIGNDFHTSPASGDGGIEDRLRNASGNTTPTLAGERLGA